MGCTPSILAHLFLSLNFMALLRQSVLRGLPLIKKEGACEERALVPLSDSNWNEPRQGGEHPGLPGSPRARLTCVTSAYNFLHSCTDWLV